MACATISWRPGGTKSLVYPWRKPSDRRFLRKRSFQGFATCAIRTWRGTAKIILYEPLAPSTFNVCTRVVNFGFQPSRLWHSPLWLPAKLIISMHLHGTFTSCTIWGMLGTRTTAIGSCGTKTASSGTRTATKGFAIRTCGWRGLRPISLIVSRLLLNGSA